MRPILALPLVLIAFGCQGGRQCVSNGCPAEVPQDEKCAAAPAPSRRCEAPPTSVTCPPTKVEVRPAQEIHVKAPPQKIILPARTPAPQMAVAQGMPAMAPVMPVQQAMAPGTPMLVQQAAVAPQQPNMVASSVQTRARGRDRFAFGLDWVRIPFPIPRLFAIPGSERVVTETEFTQVGQAALPVTTAQFAATAIPVQPIQQVAAAQVAYQAPPSAAVFQTQALAPAPQMAPMLAPAAQPVPQMVAIPATVANQCGTGQAQNGQQAASQATVDELHRQLQAFQKLWNEQNRQQGAPKP